MSADIGKASREFEFGCSLALGTAPWLYNFFLEHITSFLWFSCGFFVFFVRHPGLIISKHPDPNRARHARPGRRHRDAGKSSCDEHIRCCIDSPEADIVALISAFLRLVSIVWRTLKGVFSKSNPLNIGILHYSSCYRSGSMDPQRLWASSTFSSRYRGHFFKVDTITITIPNDYGDNLPWFCDWIFRLSIT